MQPNRCQPTRLPNPSDSPGKNNGVVAISFSNAWKWKVKGKLLSHVWPSATPCTAAFQAPPFMGFSRQEYWSGVPLILCNEDIVLQKKKKFSPRNQWGLRGSRTWKTMKPLWVWYVSHGEGSYRLFSQRTWDISCASNVPQPKARELGFHSPTSASISSFNWHSDGVSTPLY